MTQDRCRPRHGTAGVLSCAVLCYGGMASAQEIEEVIVTATKRGDSSVQEIPLSIQALGGDSLQEVGALDFNDYFRQMPGLSVNDQGPGDKRYIIAPKGLVQGAPVESGPTADIKPGNNLPLRNIPTGTTIHAVELRPGGGAKMARSAGASIQLLGKEGTYASLRMPSGEIRRVDVRCRATVGEVGNAEQANINWGKAGRMRWKGKRPTVRGVVMNPVDHPHGGGEGKTSGGRHPVSPWGKPEGRTRKAHKPSDKLIVRRRRTGKKHHR